MAIKHQQESYRTRKGVRFQCWEDCHGTIGGKSAKQEAKEVVALIRSEGIQAFYESHPDGYARVFKQAEAN
jgi:hypothetical protein